MPFCTYCGKEAPYGKKFCESCGAPLDYPVAPVVPGSVPATPVPQAVAPAASVPTAPVLPPAPPASPPKKSGKIPLVAGVIVILVLVAGIFFIGLPMHGGPKNGGAGIPQTTAPIPTPVVSLTMAQTLITQGIPDTVSPAAIPTYEERYMESYNEVYSINQPFAGGQRAIFTHDLIKPPLYIKFNITPEMHTEEKRVDIGMPSEHIVNAVYISPNAWFKVRIYDTGNNALIEEQGFNKEFSITTRQEFMVRAPGSYRVEMSGNDITAEVRILTGK